MIDRIDGEHRDRLVGSIVRNLIEQGGLSAARFSVYKGEGRLARSRQVEGIPQLADFAVSPNEEALCHEFSRFNSVS
jgi:hypothetical protein